MENLLSRKKMIKIANEVKESLDNYLSEIGIKERIKLRLAIKNNFRIIETKGTVECDYKTTYFDMWLHLLKLMNPLYSFSDSHGHPIAKWLFEIYDYNITNEEFLKRFINEYDSDNRSFNHLKNK